MPTHFANRLGSLLFTIFLAALAPAVAVAGTIVHIGEIREFNGPDDLELDPARTVVAVDVFGDSDRLVNGVLFKTDKGAVPGVTVTAAELDRQLGDAAELHGSGRGLGGQSGTHHAGHPLDSGPQSGRCSRWAV